MSTDDRYVVSRYLTIPRSYKIKKEHRCYLPVSLETTPFQRPMLDAVIDWISDNFSRCAVLVGDSVHRLTLQITRNLSQEDAKTEALRLGEVFTAENRSLFEAKMTGRYEFLKCSVIEEEHPECADYRETLWQLFNNKNNKDFQISVNESASAYVDRRFEKQDLASISMTRAEMLELSRQYLIEEMTLFATVVQMGWETDVYPGEELSALAEIANGKYPDVPEPLKRRKNVELKLKLERHYTRERKGVTRGLDRQR